jgi:short subunit fatty acids transporter
VVFNLFTFPLKRKTVCIALALLTISLASLGVRLPWHVGVSSSAKPKPRPRAIIQNQIKTCKQVMQDIPTAFAILADPPAITIPVILVLPIAVHEACYRSFSPLQQKSRDPPHDA